MFKSPSDTNIYSPGLRKTNDESNIIDKISNFVESIRLDSRGSRRIDRDHDNGVPLQGSSDTRCIESRDCDQEQPNRDRSRGQHSQACNDSSPDRIADQLLVQAERFRAKVEAPKGNYSDMIMPYDYEKLRSKFVKPEGLGPIDNEILFLRNFD